MDPVEFVKLCRGTAKQLEGIAGQVQEGHCQTLVFSHDYLQDIVAPMAKLLAVIADRTARQ